MHKTPTELTRAKLHSRVREAISHTLAIRVSHGCHATVDRIIIFHEDHEEQT